MKKRILALIAALCLIASVPAKADQTSGCLPTTSLPGLTMINSLNAWMKSSTTDFSGNSAPVTDCSLASIKGQRWLDVTSPSLSILKYYDGSAWAVFGRLDATNHIWVPPVGGGVNSLSSASLTDLWSVAQSSVTVNGTSTITDLASSSAVPGTLKIVKFSGILTLTHNATKLILPTSANITTAAGDYALVLALTSTNVQVISYLRADGTSVATSSVFIGAINFQGTITPTALSGNTNDWAPSGLSTANVIRASASAAYNLTGLTAGSSGQVIQYYNIGSFTITLKDENGSSTAANRFGFGYDIILAPKQGITLIYDTTGTRWRQVGGGGNTTGPASAGSDNIAVFDGATGKLIKDSGLNLSGARVLLNTMTASNSATLTDTTTFSTYGAAFDEFEIVFEQLLPVSNTNSSMILEVRSGGVFQTSGYLTTLVTSTNTGSNVTSNTTFIALTNAGANYVYNSAGYGGYSGTWKVHRPSTTPQSKAWMGMATYFDSGGTQLMFTTGSGIWINSAALDGFRVRTSSGNLSSGYIKVYGVK